MTVDVLDVCKSYGGVHGEANAIEHVTFSVEDATATAIVGPNGAGKSTLLRVIAGIVVPTRGEVRRPSRCASLIELGAGFHADLTGVENVQLGLALAGIAGSERRRRAREAIDFAGIGDAIDLPMKHLSNGMVARVASAVALKVDPELMLVDEVLSVGDGAFQREMLAAVADLVKGGMTLLLVTHSLELAAVAASRVIWLSDGRMVEDGDAPGVLGRYELAVRGWSRTYGPPAVRIEGLSLDPARIDPGEMLRVSIGLVCAEDSGPIDVRIEMHPAVGDDESWMRPIEESPEVRHLNLMAATAPACITRLAKGRHDLDFELPMVPITPTLLELSVVITNEAREVVDTVACPLPVGERPLRPTYALAADLRRRRDHEKPGLPRST